MTTSLLRIPTVPLSPLPEPAPVGATSRECTVPLLRMREGALADGEDTIAVEADLLVRTGDHPATVLSRTPGDDLNLVIGYLFCEGRIRSAAEVERIAFTYGSPAEVEVILCKPDPAPLTAERPPMRIAPGLLFKLKELFECRQNLFRNTGSTHAAALFSADGALLAYGEDVGRHNAFDKAIGRALLEGTLGSAAIGMLSSRIALAMAAKAAAARLPVLCGFSAATSSGVDVAKEHGITLVGRLRGKSFDIYANHWRLGNK
ncbi:formate dehydrogenase accessory sulfurtransferase FdhD [Pseudodesulfovibrio thermohalotolerans]|uniref:formate dehydrogenase accessory sulfurtransferase FdhD n=1 Tax=Pseudodesulfovibrio thermohalotolerans TaxID=2880651 RepID=UPI002442D882|nr:formate dehydrogenase accessory sulfurtransferase FdhD [Pseudodesulfovibrio thermohalotolerans]WFS61398.1 formate dehydrogenase accessory sulfurtransferase FdhD [Pseudodesulfovibrio thermohalotolerans]